MTAPRLRRRERDQDDRGGGVIPQPGVPQVGIPYAGRPSLDIEQGRARIIGTWETLVNNPITKISTGLRHEFDKSGKYTFTELIGKKTRPKQFVGYWELIIPDDGRSYQVNLATTPVTRDGKADGIKTPTSFLVRFEGNDTMIMSSTQQPQNARAIAQQMFARKKD
jgi:hypothetical protein